MCLEKWSTSERLSQMPVVMGTDVGLAGSERSGNPNRPLNAFFPPDLASSAQVLIDSFPD
jgi:hypothetical protein